MLGLKKGDVVTLWVNQVMYPGVVTSVDGQWLEMDSVQYKGLKYKVKPESVTAVSIDSNTDTLEKLEAQKKAFDEKQAKAAAEMRAEAEAMAGNK
jgi:hypothetical protein